MMKRISCPKCRARLTVSVRLAPSIAVEAEANTVAHAEIAQSKLPERIERCLARAGRRGMTIRELRHALRGAKREDIFNVLLYELGEASDAPVVDEERRGRAHYFVLRRAAFAEASEAIDREDAIEPAK